MRNRVFVLPVVFLLLFCFVQVIGAHEIIDDHTVAITPYSATDIPPMNCTILEVIKEYPTDGTLGYWWPRNGESNYDGVTEDISYKGEVVFRGEPKKQSYCCGLTLEVFMKAAMKEMEKQEKDSIGGMTAAEVTGSFQHLWFCPAMKAPGPAEAMEAFGIGETITDLNDVRPGDFVQIWRCHGSGHSVIFIDWVRDEDGNATGMKYWSTQPATDGVGERVEMFGPPEGVHTQETIFSRFTNLEGKIEESITK